MIIVGDSSKEIDLLEVGDHRAIRPCPNLSKLLLVLVFFFSFPLWKSSVDVKKQVG
jgi:hypothetical protein